MQFTKREKNGLYCIAKLIKLTVYIPEHRGLVYGYHAGHKYFEDEIYLREYQVDELLKKLAQNDPLLLTMQDGETKIHSIKQEWSKIKKQTFLPTVSPVDLFKQHTDLIGSVLDLVFGAAIQSGLYLDPELTSHHVIDALILDIPHLTEHIGQARGLGAGIVSQQYLSEDDRYELIKLSSLIRDRQNRITHNIKACILSNPSHQEKIQDQVNAATISVDTFLSIVSEQLLTASITSLSPTEYFSAGTSAISNSLYLMEQFIHLVEEILDSRLRGMRNKVVFRTSLILMGVFITLYLYAGFYLNILQSILKLRAGARHFSGNDFSNSICIDSNDELRLVAESFNEMAYKLEIHSRLRQESEQALLAAHHSLQSKNEQLAREIAKKENIQFNLKASEKNFRSLIENSLVGIFIIQNHQIIFSNPEQQRIFCSIRTSCGGFSPHSI